MLIYSGEILSIKYGTVCIVHNLWHHKYVVVYANMYVFCS